MISTIFLHNWKSFIRNGAWRRGIASKIMIAVLILYISTVFVYIGLHIDSILSKTGGNVIEKFNSLIIWYFIGDLFFRCMFQPQPTLDIIPYMRLKLRRNKLVSFFILKSFGNFFNLLPWLILVPFIVKVLFIHESAIHVSLYVVSLLMLLIFNNLLALYQQFLSLKNPVLATLPFILVLVIFVILKAGISFNSASIYFFGSILHGNVFMTLIIAFFITLLLYLIRQLLSGDFYLDGALKSKQKSEYTAIPGLKLLDKLGETGRYMTLELQLLLRNKRPRQALVMLPIIVAYFIFMTSKDKGFNGSLTSVLISAMIFGMGSLIYGQFIFSWESAYFDGIVSRKLNFEKYVAAKYYLMSTLSLIVAVPIIIAFMLRGAVDPLTLISLLMFNLGITQFIALLSGTFNDGRIDLSKKQMFNYQGVRGNQFILSFIFVLLPLGIYTSVNHFFGSITASVAVLIPGLIFILFHRWWIAKFVIPLFMKRKYKNLDGFRKLNM